MPDLTNRNSNITDENWMSISDMMSGLMVIFLFISISYMLYVNVEKEKIQEIAVTYNRLKDDLYKDMYNEFKGDLPGWGAEIDRETLSVRFQAPEVLFERGDETLKVKFENIVNDFFPRFVSIITNPKYKADIEEVRIEGHTSSEWEGAAGARDDAYFMNMELSQNRTRSVLRYILTLPSIDKDWIKGKVTANGLSSSRPIVDGDGKEDKDISRRVEFRIRTNAENSIVKIIEQGKLK